MEKEQNNSNNFVLVTIADALNTASGQCAWSLVVGREVGAAEAVISPEPSTESC